MVTLYRENHQASRKNLLPTITNSSFNNHISYHIIHTVPRIPFIHTELRASRYQGIIASSSSLFPGQSFPLFFSLAHPSPSRIALSHFLTLFLLFLHLPHYLVLLPLPPASLFHLLSFSCGTVTDATKIWLKAPCIGNIENNDRRKQGIASLA